MELVARFLEFRDRRQKPSRKRGVLYAAGSSACGFFQRSFAKRWVTMSNEFTFCAVVRTYAGLLAEFSLLAPRLIKT